MFEVTSVIILVYIAIEVNTIVVGCLYLTIVITCILIVDVVNPVAAYCGINYKELTTVFLCFLDPKRLVGGVLPYSGKEAPHKAE